LEHFFQGYSPMKSMAPASSRYVAYYFHYFGSRLSFEGRPPKQKPS
jgi:hypothetical protein